MKCTCPKCHGKIEVELPEVTEEGTSTSCPACKAHFTAYKESFGGRALRKTGELSCASCGNELGPQMHCITCGVSFPDYLIAAVGRKQARKTSPKMKLPLGPPRKEDKAVVSNIPTLDSATRQDSAAPNQQPVAKGVPKSRIVAVSVIALLVVIAVGAVWYFKKGAETTYLRNFALATYTIQVGADTSRKTCLKVATDWKSSIDAGKSYLARPSAEEAKVLASISAKLTATKAKLSEEPAKFKGCKENLAKIEGAYNKLQSLALAPGDSLQTFTESYGKLDSEYQQASNQFKTGIPPEAMEELQSASQKYRGLRPLLK